LINLGKESLINGQHDFTYEGTWRNLLPAVDTTFDIREQSGHTLKSSLKYTCSIDRRTNQALPEDGGFLKTSVELAGLGGDIKFAKFNKDYQYSKTLLKYIVRI
jgi:outer membrane protein insertion porin family